MGGSTEIRTEQALREVEERKSKDHPQYYRALPRSQSSLVRAYYASRLSIPQRGSPRLEVRNRCGTPISRGYRRVVIGDYGAFIEFDNGQAATESFESKFPGDPPPRIAYLWLETRDDDRTKIYHQRRRVQYADYVPGCYYVDPKDVVVGIRRDIPEDLEWRPYYRIAHRSHLLEAKRAVGGEQIGHAAPFGKARKGDWLCRSPENGHTWTISDEFFELTYCAVGKMPQGKRKEKGRKSAAW